MPYICSRSPNIHRNLYNIKVDREYLKLATTEPPTPKLPVVIASPKNSRIEPDRQQRLWYFMKCYRKATLFRNDFD